MPVCFQFAEKGTCRFGDKCRFEHVAGATRPPRRAPTVRVVINHRPVPNHIVQFFSKYPRFDYDPDNSFIDEFHRMCDYFHWSPNSEEQSQAQSELSHAMVLQFNDTFGTNADDFASWQKMCEIIQIDPVPDNLDDCRRAVLTSHVNICDLLDAPFLGEAPKRFPTEVALSAYTLEKHKIFWKRNVAEGSLLGYLLRHILNPRPEREVRPKRKGRAS